MAGLYIHIPFCHSKCSYCDFYSIPAKDGYGEYVAALLCEWRHRRHEIDGDPLSTIYIGGGTPSILPYEYLKVLIDGLKIPLTLVKEFTIEVNPEDITPGYVDDLIKLGVNRVSMGVQSLDDRELMAVGRRHTAIEALGAIEILKNCGMNNISCDLIYGLPLQNADSWGRSLDALIDTGIQHLSAYILSYEKGTRLWAQREAGKVHDAPENLIIEMYEILLRKTQKAGYEHYEISNFAKSGYRSVHNSSYWQNVKYLGIGVAAHSYDGTVRRYNPSRLKEYLQAPASVTLADDYDLNTSHNDAVVTELRTSWGLDISDFTDEEIDLLRYSVGRGEMERLPSGRYRIKESCWLIADKIMSQFIRV